MKLLTTILLSAAAASASAQITMTSASSQQNTTTIAYDSSYNFIPERYSALKGQTVYFIPISEGYSHPPTTLSGFYAPNPHHHKHEGEKKEEKKEEEKEKHKGSGFGNALLKHAPGVGLVNSSYTHGNSSTLSNNNNYAEPAPVNDKNVYKAELIKYQGQSYHETPVSEILGKYFKVLDFVDSSADGKSFGFLVKLAHADNPADYFYYRIANSEQDMSHGNYTVNFMTVGYFEKKKKECLNKNFYLSTYKNDVKDLASGANLQLTNYEEKWHCYDVTLLQDKYIEYAVHSLLLENTKGNKIAAYFFNTNGLVVDASKAIPFDGYFITEDAHNEIVKAREEKARLTEEKRKKDEAERLAAVKKDAEDLKKQQAENIKKYGQKNGTLINSGQVAIGMNKQMCRAAWGDPKDINTTTTMGHVHEQWVYGDITDGGLSFLYFSDGVLTSIQN